MGAIADSADGLTAAIGRADLSSARKLEAVLSDLQVFEARVAAGKRVLAARIQDEFPADPGVPAMVRHQARLQDKFGAGDRAVAAALRRAHPREWERLDNPGVNAQAWDQRANLQQPTVQQPGVSVPVGAGAAAAVPAAGAAGAGGPVGELAGFAAAAAAAGDRVVRERLYGGMEAVTELVRLPDGRRAVRKTPRRDQDADEVRLVWDAEQLAGLVADAVRAPVAATYRDGPASLWVQWIDGRHVRPGDDGPGGLGALADSPAAVRIGLLDALLDNRDRDGGLLVNAGGRLVGIDQGAAWMPWEIGDRGPYLREPAAPMAHFVAGETWRADAPVTAGELTGIASQLQALRPQFDRLGRTGWLDHSLTRLHDLLHTIRQHPTTDL